MKDYVELPKKPTPFSDFFRVVPTAVEPDQKDAPDPNEKTRPELYFLQYFENGKLTRVGTDAKTLSEWIAGEHCDSKDAAQANPLRARYGTTPSGFMRPEHTLALLKFCQDEGLYVSVRDTGQLSLIRILSGQACKPHDILDKSIKSKAVQREKKNMQAMIDCIKALPEDNKMVLRYEVPKEYKPPPAPTKKQVVDPNANPYPPVTDNEIKGTKEILKFLEDLQKNIDRALTDMGEVTDKADDKHPLRSCLGLIGWWAKVTTPKVLNAQKEPCQFLAPLGVLRVGKKKKDAPAKYVDGVPLPFAQVLVNKLPVDGYTGDYDLHDVLKKQGEELTMPDARPGTPKLHRARAIDAISNLQTLVSALASTPGVYRERNVPDDPADPYGSFKAKSDRYANVVQHGPQSYYAMYLNNHNDDIYKKLDTLRSLLGRLTPSLSRLQGDLEPPATTGLFKPDADGIVAICPAELDNKRNRFQKVYCLFGEDEVRQYYQMERLEKSAFTFGRGIDKFVFANLPAEIRDAVNTELGPEADCLNYDYTAQYSNPVVSTDWRKGSDDEPETFFINMTKLPKIANPVTGKYIWDYVKNPPKSGAADYYRKLNRRFIIGVAPAKAANA